MTYDQSSRKLTRKPVILTAAALIAGSALALTLGNMVPFAVAETATQSTIGTASEHAPLSFADIAQKVTPAVVSINVKTDARVAENDESSEGDQIPGMPDIPKDSPLYDFFKQFRKNMPQHAGEAAAHACPRVWLLHLARRLRRDQQPRGRGRRGHHRHDGERRQISGQAGRHRSAHRRGADQGQGPRARPSPSSSSRPSIRASATGCSPWATRSGSAAR